MRLKKVIIESATAYLFLIPWIIGIFAFTFIPMFTSLYYSFTDHQLFNSPAWVGWDNYNQILFYDHKFLDSLKVTLKYVFIGVPLELAFALSIALMLRKGRKGIRVYRAVYYIPSLLGGSVAIALLWREVFGSDGMVNQFMSLFGVERISFIYTPDYALYTLILLKVWQFGTPMIIFLAGLQQIPKDLYEAASIDGAGRWRQFYKVTLPLITPIIFFNIVMQIISSFQAFTPAFIVSGGDGGPLNSTLFYTLYLYQKGVVNFQLGYAFALSWILLVIISVFTAVAFLTSKKWVHYEN